MKTAGEWAVETLWDRMCNHAPWPMADDVIQRRLAFIRAIQKDAKKKKGKK